jgi:polysaccharide export outer membrane protein
MTSAVTHPAPEYRIGPLDTIDVTVFQEPDLSAKALAVDASGNVVLPLVGSFPAAGKTTNVLSAEIARKLGERYLVDPQVSVAVASSVSQKVVVQGQVVEPGVYDVKGSTTLLETLSMAKGETGVASLNRVVVYRTINGQRMGALFNVSAIRNGTAKDPDIFGNDVVIVGYSEAKSIWRDILSTSPLLNVFRPLGY